MSQEDIAQSLNEAYRYVHYARSWLERPDEEITQNKPKILSSLEKAEKRIAEIQEFYKV